MALVKKLKDFFWYEEGKVSNFLSIGWGFYNTFFIIKLRLPVFVWIKSQLDWPSGDTLFGHHVCYLYLSFRISSAEQYKKSGKLCLGHCGFYWQAIEDCCSRWN